MVAPLLMTVLALLVVAGIAWVALSRDRVDETARFNRAREITSSWADPDILEAVQHAEDPVAVPDRDGYPDHR
jgi:hypothetical protein